MFRELWVACSRPYCNIAPVLSPSGIYQLGRIVASRPPKCFCSDYSCDVLSVVSGVHVLSVVSGVRRRRRAGERDKADRRRIPDTTTCTKPLGQSYGDWFPICRRGHQDCCVFKLVIGGGLRPWWALRIGEMRGEGVFMDRNDPRGHTWAVPGVGRVCWSGIWRIRIMGYKESNAGTWRYATTVAGPCPQSTTRRWPTLQTGQSGRCGSMTVASTVHGGSSWRQCWTIFFRMRLERNPKCRILTKPLGSTCR